MLKKFLLVFGVIIIFTVYSLYQYNGFITIGDDVGANNETSALPQTLPTASAPISGEIEDDDMVPVATNPVTSPAPVATPAPVKTPTPTTPTGVYRNGTYNGNIVNAYYGNIQVQVVISNGKISDVIFLNYPSDRRNSIAINNYAMPILKSETIQAQSASVNAVSGATFTSQAFNQSLTSALNQAKI